MKAFTLSQAKEIAQQLGIDFENTDFTAEEFLAGLHVELEHGLVDGFTNVTHDDPLTTGKIVLAHLNENYLYYDANIGVEAWEHALDKIKHEAKEHAKGGTGGKAGDASKNMTRGKKIVIQ